MSSSPNSPRRRSDPKRPGELLDGILRRVRTSSRRAELNRALTEILGEDVAAACEVRSFRGGKLVLEVASAPSFAELAGFEGENLRLRLNERLTTRRVAEIVFRMGGTGHV